MNSFIKSFFASLLAIIVAIGLFTFIGFISFALIIGSVFSSKTEVITPKANSILKINLNSPVVETISDNPIDYLDVATMEFRPNITAYELIKSIKIASFDPNIIGIYLDIPSNSMIDLANMEEVRSALIDFKNTGKKIYSYADNYSQKSYFLSSVADSIYLCPIGDVEWKGIGGSNMFFKNALDKLGVKVEVFKYGKYKSAVEPMLFSKMSAESRLQSERLYDNIWGQMVASVSAFRGIDSTKLQDYASTLRISNAEAAKELKFVDKLMYRAEAETEIKKMHSNSNMISISNYITQNSGNNLITGEGSLRNQIQIIYANGEIIGGKSQMGIIGDITTVAKIRQAADNDNVKAIVLRVNSPGGSALASDIIDKEVRRAKKKKPIVVSMGAYAASGGYYISTSADAIVASPYTLTGSIGVFGLMFEASESLKNNLGITFDVVKTNQYADMGSIVRPMTDTERNYIQAGVDRVYETFINCVAEGRNMSVAAVDSIAQGRVWCADDALAMGLIDMKGGLIDAVTLAASKADILENYIIINSPSKDDMLTSILQSMNSESVKTIVQKVFVGNSSITDIFSNELKSLELILKGDRIQAISPIRIEL